MGRPAVRRGEGARGEAQAGKRVSSASAPLDQADTELPIPDPAADWEHPDPSREDTEEFEDGHGDTRLLNLFETGVGHLDKIRSLALSIDGRLAPLVGKAQDRKVDTFMEDFTQPPQITQPPIFREELTPLKEAWRVRIQVALTRAGISPWLATFVAAVVVGAISAALAVILGAISVWMASLPAGWP